MPISSCVSLSSALAILQQGFRWRMTWHSRRLSWLIRLYPLEKIYKNSWMGLVPTPSAMHFGFLCWYLATLRSTSVSRGICRPPNFRLPLGSETSLNVLLAVSNSRDFSALASARWESSRKQPAATYKYMAGDLNMSTISVRAVQPYQVFCSLRLR